MGATSVSDRMREKYGYPGSNPASGNQSASGGSTSVRDRLMEKYSYEAVQGRRNQIDSWVRQYNYFMDKVSGYGNGWLSQDDRKAIQDAADSLISGYDGISEYAGRMGFPNSQRHLEQVKNIRNSLGYYDNWESEEDYNASMRDYEYQQKYGGKSYSELQGIISGLDDGDEKDWLSLYAPTTITDREYGGWIAQVNTDLYYTNKFITDYTALQNSSGQSGEEADEAIRLQGQQLLQQYGFASLQEAKQKLERLKASKWTLDRERMYSNLESNPDFERYSKPSSETPTAGFGIQFGKHWLGKGDAKYDYINNLGNAQELVAEERGQEDNVNPYGMYDLMKPEEVARYNYLYHTQGEKSADEYLDYLEYTLSERNSQKVQQVHTALADGHPILANGLSVFSNLQSGVGILDVAAQKAGNIIASAITGEEQKPINYYRAAAPSIATSAIRGTTAQEIADKTGVIHFNEEEHPVLSKVLNGKSLGDLYQLGMSMVDSLAAGKLAPGIGNAGTVLLGGSAGTQAMLDAVEKGATDDQAIMMGLLNGAAEIVFETYEVENLLGSSSNILKSVLNQALTEAIGEGATTISNDLADILVMQDKSEFMTNVREYQNQGMSKEKAELQAFLDAAIVVGWDAIGGGLSGGLFGLAGPSISSANDTNQNVNTTKNSYSTIEEAGESGTTPPNTAAGDAARQVQNGSQPVQSAQTSKMAGNDTVASALNYYTENGRVSNSMAGKVLGDPQAVRELQEKTGMELPKTIQGATRSENLAAVKSAIAQLAVQQQESSESMLTSIGSELQLSETAKEAVPTPAGESPKNGSLTTLISPASENIVQNSGDEVNINSDERTSPWKSTLVGNLHVDNSGGNAASESGNGLKRKFGHVKGYGVKIEDINKALNPTQKKALNVLTEISKVTGIDIVLYKSTVDSNGNLVGGIVEGIDMRDSQGAFSFHNNKIYIDLNAGLLKGAEMKDVAKYSMLRTFTHEFTHFIEKWNAAEYENLRAVVFDTMRKNGADPDSMISARMERNKKLTEDQASREVVAEAMTDILPQSSFVQNLAEKHRNIFRKLCDKLKEFTARIKEYFDSIGETKSFETQAIKEAFGEALRYNEEIVTIFDRAAEGAVESYQDAVAAKKSTTQEGGVQHEIRKSFYREIDAWDGKSKATFQVGRTSDALKSIGVKDLGIVWHGGKISEIMRKHTGMTKEIIKQVPKILEEPIIILESKNSDSRLAIFGTVKDKNGTPVTAILELQPTNKGGQLMNMNIIASAYGKDNTKGLVESSGLVYLNPDINKTKSWMQSVGLQLPSDTTNLGPIGTISYPDGKVKIESVPYKQYMLNPGKKTTAKSGMKKSGESHQERTSTLTNRDILANALETVAQNEQEMDALREYRDSIQKADELEAKISGMKNQLSELSKKTGKTQADKNTILKLRSEIEKAERSIKRYDSSILKLEAAKPVKAMLERERTRVRRQTRNRYQESADVAKQRAEIERNVKDLAKMIAHPTKDAHVPTDLHQPLQEFLDSIDFTSRQQAHGGGATIRDIAYTRALDAVRTSIAAQRTALGGEANGTYSLDVPPKFLEDIERHSNSVKAATKGMDLTTNRVYEMSSDELKDLNYLLTTINKAIRNIDRLHMEGAKARVSELGDSTVREMGRRKPVKGETGGTAMWANYTPSFAFERMGVAATQILDGLKQGQAKLARTVNAAIRFAGETYTDKEVKSWERDIHTVQLDSGESVQLTTAQIMSIYCLSKRNHAMGHLSGGGIRVSTIGEGSGKIVQKKHFILSAQDIGKITGILNNRQITVARALQNYMQTVGGRLGNEISMARWGFMAMTEENYFPIRSDSDVHDGKNPDQDRANLWALLNKSFTKGLTEGANDAIVVSSIFDVFADHMSEMAEYNAFALPLVDAMRWYNYRSTTRIGESQIETVGVKKALNDTLGTAAGKYFIDLMTDINSSQKGGRYEDFLGKQLSRQKAAAVGWNLRVAIQQPTAILRASLYLDMPSLLKGSARIKTKALAEEMNKYSGIALWKSMGFYNLNVGMSVREQIKGDTGILDKMKDAGMWLPGKMDEITWARIWAACKEKVGKEKKLTGEALLIETAKLFDDLVYHTQVADSVLCKSSIMRSKSQAVKEFTSFMAEPTVSVNILMSAFQDYTQGKTKWEYAKRAMMIGFKGYALSSLVNALVISFADAWRDDDEYEEFYEKYLQALLGEKFIDGNLFDELNPLGKIVFVKDILSMMKGYDVKNTYIELVQSCIDIVGDLQRYFSGKGKLTEYGLIYKGLNVLGSFTGFAPSNLLREVVAVWNNTVGRMHPNMMIHRYDTDQKTKIRNAFRAGSLTNQEAIRELLLAGEVESENEAYFMVKKWDTGDDSKYDDLYEAARNGKSIDSAVEELTSHGHKKEDVISTLKSQIGKWYYDPESDIHITRDDAVSMLEQYTDLNQDEIFWTMDEWDYRAETGSSEDYSRYNKIFDALLSGGDIQAEIYRFTENGYEEDTVLENIRSQIKGWAFPDKDEKPVISEKDAEKMLQKYGGMTDYDAKERIADWKFEAEHGYAYADIKSTYLDKEITRTEAISVMTQIGGKSREDAEQRVRYWDYEEKTGVDYENKSQQYKRGIITRQQLRKALMDLGGYSGADADIQIEVYDWEQSGLQGVNFGRVKNWREYCEGAGVSKSVWLKISKFAATAEGEKKSNGKTIQGSKAKKIMAEINSLSISKSQKDAIALAIAEQENWSSRTIAKYKLW